MTNSADPDQLASQKPTDLDLHCLLRRGTSCSARERLSVPHTQGTRLPTSLSRKPQSDSFHIKEPKRTEGQLGRIP